MGKEDKPGGETSGRTAGGSRGGGGTDGKSGGGGGAAEPGGSGDRPGSGDALRPGSGDALNLLLLPGQCNYTGKKFDLGWIQRLKRGELQVGAGVAAGRCWGVGWVVLGWC